MRALVFYTSTDRKGRHDATGAFIPEAQAFARLHGVDADHTVGIPQDIPIWDRRGVVRWALERERTPLEAVAYFGHGSRSSLPGLGLRVAHVNFIADLLAARLTPSARVIYYACLAGQKFGIADRIDLALSERGFPDVVSVAHLTAGHASWNPYVERSGEGPSQNGVPIIERSDPLWATWVAALRADQRFRLSFPFWTEATIRAYLRGEGAATCPTCGLEVPR